MPIINIAGFEIRWNVWETDFLLQIPRGKEDIPFLQPLMSWPIFFSLFITSADSFLRLFFCFYPSFLLSFPIQLSHSIQFSHSVMSDSLWPHGLQYAKLPCPSPTHLCKKVLKIDVYAKICVRQMWFCGICSTEREHQRKKQQIFNCTCKMQS